MKIRNGFVSNSSSTSFCILGVPLSSLNLAGYDEDIKGTIWKTERENKKKGINNSLKCARGIEEYYNDSILGIEPNDIKDDETIAQGKQRVVELLKSQLDVDVNISDIGWCVDGGHDD